MSAGKKNLFEGNKKLEEELNASAKSYFEPKLDALGLSTDAIKNQSLSELKNSLNTVDDAMQNSEQFGTLNLSVSAEGALFVAKATTSRQFQVGILPILLERKRLITDRITQLEKPQGSISPEAPKIIRHIEWFLRFGTRNLGAVTIAFLILVVPTAYTFWDRIYGFCCSTEIGQFSVSVKNNLNHEISISNTAEFYVTEPTSPGMNSRISSGLIRLNGLDGVASVPARENATFSGSVINEKKIRSYVSDGDKFVTVIFSASPKPLNEEFILNEDLFVNGLNFEINPVRRTIDWLPVIEEDLLFPYVLVGTWYNRGYEQELFDARNNSLSDVPYHFFVTSEGIYDGRPLAKPSVFLRGLNVSSMAIAVACENWSATTGEDTCELNDGTVYSLERLLSHVVHNTKMTEGNIFDRAILAKQLSADTGKNLVALPSGMLDQIKKVISQK